MTIEQLERIAVQLTELPAPRAEVNLGYCAPDLTDNLVALGGKRQLVLDMPNVIHLVSLTIGAVVFRATCSRRATEADVRELMALAEAPL